ncbi:MAG TPA: N-acetylmuramoyl-L-alanine amidase [Clostridia bacterium]|nr:N-acetylmuramoyl-L-alanine amidase [Clostridia bacterium]
MHKKILFCAALSILLVFACGLGIYSVTRVMNNLHSPASPMIIIDAGHGGMDGGATGVDDILEKDINLSISKKLCSLAQLNGYDVIMVRSTDESVHEEGVTGVRKQKVSDIHHRLALAKQHPDAIFISIHQNYFPKRSPWGTQVFYSTNNPQSRSLAQKIQDNIRNTLQPENKREIKPAGSNLYILSHTSNPAVMVECGFISNSDDSQRLQQPEYQQQLAFKILQSVTELQIQNGKEGEVVDGSES